METTRISRLLPLLLALAMVACASAPARDDDRPVATDPAPTTLSVPDHALDVLPLEHLLAAEFALREDNLDAAAEAYLEATLASDRVEVARRATRVNLAAQRWPAAATALARWRLLAGDQADQADLRQAGIVLALGQGDGDSAHAGLLQLLAGGGMDAARLGTGALEAAPDRGLGVQVLERLVAEGGLPDDRAVMIGLSQLAMKFERPDLAGSIAVRASERMPEAPEIWFWRARLATAAGDRAQARVILEQAVATNPDSIEIRRTYAVLLRTELDDPAGAAAALAELPPDDETLALRAAYALEAQDWRQTEAVQAQLAALPQPPPAGRLMLLGGVAEALAEVAEADGSAGAERVRRWRAEALEWYQAVPADAEEHARALQRMAVLEQQAGRLDEALMRLAQLREQVNPDSPAFAESFLLESELLDRSGRRDDALAALDLGLAALPDEPRLRYSRGLMRERQDQVEGALDDFRFLVESDPDNPVYLNAYGYTLSDRTDRQDEALVLIERALQLNPEDVATTDSMGWVLFKLGRHEEALVFLRRAYEQQDDGEIAAHLGEVLWVTGEREQAREIWRKALERDPDSRVLRATMERLQP